MMRGPGNSMNKFKKSPQESKKIQMSTLSKFSSTIKGDMRKQGSPFRFITAKNPTCSLVSYESRRELGQGRINKNFKGKTNKVYDDDIKTLISKYPLEETLETLEDDKKETDDSPRGKKKKECFNENSTDPTYIAIHSPTKDKTVKKQLLQKALGNLTRNIDKIELSSKQYYKNMMTKLVLQNLRDAELVKLSEAFKEIDYADIDQLQNLFEYRNKDQIEKIRGQVDVAKEYHEGKLDP